MEGHTETSEQLVSRVQSLTLREDSDSEKIDWTPQIKLIEAAGFSANGKILKLLKKTGGNVDAILQFLNSKKTLMESVKENKSKKFKSKEEKLMKKLERLSNKADKKNKKKEEKILKKMQKVNKCAKKHEEKKSKKMNEANNNSITTERSFGDSDETIPSNFKKIYLDGNNMLFVLSAIRNYAVRGGLAKAAQMLQSLVEAYSSARPDLTKLVLVFDTTPVNLETAILKVCTARPTYATSDDALVDWLSNSDEEIYQSCVITSDRGLKDRLNSLGVATFGPKTWFRDARKNLSAATDQNLDLDLWATAWFENSAN